MHANLLIRKRTICIDYNTVGLIESLPQALLRYKLGVHPILSKTTSPNYHVPFSNIPYKRQDEHYQVNNRKEEKRTPGFAETHSPSEHNNTILHMTNNCHLKICYILQNDISRNPFDTPCRQEGE